MMVKLEQHNLQQVVKLGEVRENYFAEMKSMVPDRKARRYWINSRNFKLEGVLEY